jgi:hypothetical protein
MEHRINIELAEQNEAEVRSRTRRRWPDDGLPPRHRSTRTNGSLHPVAILADILGR